MGNYHLTRPDEIPILLPANTMVAEVDGEKVYVFPEGTAFVACREDFIGPQESTFACEDTESEAIDALLEAEALLSSVEVPSESESSSQAADSEQNSADLGNDSTTTEDNAAQGSTEGVNLGNSGVNSATNEVDPPDPNEGVSEEDDPPPSLECDAECSGCDYDNCKAHQKVTAKNRVQNSKK